MNKRHMFDDKGYVAIPTEVWDEFCRLSAYFEFYHSRDAIDWHKCVVLMGYTKVGFDGGKMQKILDQYVDFQNERANESKDNQDGEDRGTAQ